MSIKSYRFDGGKNLRLQEQPTGAGEQKQQKAELKANTAENLRKAALLAEKLCAAGTEGLVIAIQARDAAGKDSLIKHVFSALNPQAMEVHAFKTPTSQELSHDYLWRIVQALPPRGKVGILNRSHYEDVLVVKVHHLEKTYRMAPRCLGDDFFEKRYRQLRHFEEYLYENSYRVVKLFLNVSREEQKKRFLDRIEREDKHWKLSTADMKERALWAEYDAAYEDCINATATEHAPWYVLPADDKWYTRYLVSEILLDTLTEMKPEFPPLSATEMALVPSVKAELESGK